jgi:hypothetical protein
MELLSDSKLLWVQPVLPTESLDSRYDSFCEFIQTINRKELAVAHWVRFMRVHARSISPKCRDRSMDLVLDKLMTRLSKYAEGLDITHSTIRGFFFAVSCFFAGIIRAGTNSQREETSGTIFATTLNFLSNSDTFVVTSSLYPHSRTTQGQVGFP